ncbi:ATP-binding protein [Streptomyces sp. NRRL F-5755]|uniref:FxSxx-COOH system tetratricopeptide repeat protein n=1 Tax=Streptomyces sp. NRRL F-5755 TaxID=1519475 RepID=UPI0006AF8302|nr:FxSxx-COOH system tetratricopeptide repeat protein [Streptomyces sp. NRRL F-5755]KOT90412.1 ATP-binding protein [Streptomyces sp. NRRL F-5755]
MTAAGRRPHQSADTAESRVAVARTGSAGAASEGTAVTGYHGSPPSTGGAPAAQIQVSGTGNSNATGEGSLSNTGYIDKVSVERLTVVQGVPREPAAWPHQVGPIPGRAQSFQHRAEADRLQVAADGGGTTVLGQVLTGMGGVGKTQLAADYALTAWDNASGDYLDVLVWVTASTRQAIVDGYAQAGIELCRADPDDPDQAARCFLAWLTAKAGARPCRWLIVLDDVADPADLVAHPDDPAARYSLWPPASPHGRTLVTTRRRDAALTGDGRHRIDIGLYTPAEAVAYLTAALAAHGRHEPDNQLTALAADLGHLPLALAQAAAYLIDSGDDAAAYRDLLADRTTTLTDLSPDALPDAQATALAAAWSLSIDRADTLRPPGLARPMLQLAALLDPNGIPQDVLTSEPARTYLTEHRTAAGQDPTPPPSSVPRRDAVRALRALDRLSLIDHTPDAPHRAVRIHQLIQRATREAFVPALTSAEQDRYVHTAADALLAAWPDTERDTALAQALRANITALTRHAEDALYRPYVHAVLYRTGNSLGEAGQVAAARDHYQQLTDTVAARLGPDHPDTLTARHVLARWRGAAGDTVGAVTALGELLADQQPILGPAHPAVLAMRADFAHLSGKSGDASGAASAAEKLLVDQTRVLGPDHPGTLGARGLLAYWKGRAGDAMGAVSDYRALLADEERVLGPYHPNTLTTRNHVARWRGESGDRAGAAAASAELFELVRHVLGSDHPVTLSTQISLARWRGEAGDAAEAVAAFAELLKTLQRLWGPDHPDTLATRGQLARFRGKAGDIDGAVRDYAALLADRRRVLGPDHHHTLITRQYLARWRGEAGNPAGAAAALGALLTDQQRVLGLDHPHTIATRHALVHWRGRAGSDVAGAQQSTDC